MKILYLAVGVFDKGGISRYCRYQISALRAIVGEDNVRVFSLMGPAENDFEDGFSVNRAFSGFGFRSEASFFLAAARTARAEHPDVIWSSHLRFVVNGLIGRALSRGKLVVNAYGEEVWSGKLLPFHKMMLPRADLVMSDCEFTAEYIANNYNVGRSRLAVVWDCVDVGRFEPRPRRADLLKRFKIPAGCGCRYVMTLGRIEARSRYKGYDRLLDAIAALRRHPRIVLLIAGAGDDVERLRSRARGEGLEDRVVFLGSIPEDQLCDVYNLCDVFVLVSDRGPGRGEGIPLTPLEAAACAKPIIVGDEDGSREAVVSGLNGFCVSPRDPQGLSDALEKIVLDDTLRLNMGRAARRRIEAEFSYDTFRRKTAALLERLCARS